MPTPIRVFVNACTAGDYGAGIPTYGREIAAALARRGDIEACFASDAEAPAGTTPVEPPAKHRQMWTQFTVPRLMRKLGANVYLGTEYSAPVFSRVPRVVMVHDLAHRFMPKLYNRRGLLHVRMLFETLRRSERLIAPTASVATDIVHYLGYPRRRIRVIPEAARSGVSEVTPEAIADMRDRFGLHRPYVLCVGALNRHKRTVDVIRALAMLPEDAGRPDLVVAGAMNTGLFPAYRAEALRLGVEKRLRFPGYVTDADLSSLYTGAEALVFPSTMEGFGMPPLEAMACGTPVIASDIAPLRETLGDAAMFVPTRAPGSIAKFLALLMTTPSAGAEWAARGRERARLFNWDRSADETAKVFRELA